MDSSRTNLNQYYRQVSQGKISRESSSTTFLVGVVITNNLGKKYQLTTRIILATPLSIRDEGYGNHGLI
jgi:hypothetical protein